MKMNKLRAAALASAAFFILTAQVASAAACPTITRTLKYGMSGTDVTALQTYLASDATLYPEAAITGFFGRATERAVQRFQAAHNIVSTGSAATTGYGSVGAKTRAALASCASGAPAAKPATTAASTTAPAQTQTTQTTQTAPSAPSGPIVTFDGSATTTVTPGAGPLPTLNIFSVAPRIVDIPGAQTNMYWTSSNTINCSVEQLQGSGYVALAQGTNAGVNGSTNMNPTDDRTVYSLHCIGIGDNSSSSPAEIRRDVMIRITNPKPTCTVTTDKASYLYAKDTIKLSWTSTGADQIAWAHTAADTSQPVALPYGNLYPSGYVFLSSVAGPSQTPTLNVSGPGGTATCSKTFSITSNDQ